MRFALIALLTIAGLGVDAGADPVDLRERNHVFTLKSSVLDEQREIFVRVPRDYDSEQRYPVVYVLDGEWNFDLVASYLDYHTNEGLYPALIVTGIRNVNRNRDYVPRADSHFPYTGDADKFLRFVETEWQPLINTRYSTAPQRALVGHSFGGTFALHALFSAPASFDAYIALSASTWVADRVLFDEAAAFFDDYTGKPRFVYMAVGEADGGATVPDGEAMASLFETGAPDSIEWYFDIHPRAEHFLNFTSGMHQGFQRLFPRWQFESELQQAAISGGAEAVTAWFDNKRDTLGWRFRPSWFDIGVAALRLAGAGHHDAAICVIEQLRDYAPEHPHVLAFAGSVYRNAGELERARAAVTRAIEVTREQDADPNIIQLPRLERQLAGIDELIAQDAAEDTANQSTD